MAELTGWLLDVYAGEQGLTIWLLGEDGERRCLHQELPDFLLRCQSGGSTIQWPRSGPAGGLALAFFPERTNAAGAR